MSTPPTGKHIQDDPEVHRLLDFALKEIEENQKSNPSQLATEMGRAQNAISLLRNRLIDYYRAAGSTPHSDLGRMLGKINMALSHIVGIEYPLSGIHRNLLEEAEKLLRELPIKKG